MSSRHNTELIPLCVCVCVCVCERERERERVKPPCNYTFDVSTLLKTKRTSVYS